MVFSTDRQTQTDDFKKVVNHEVDVGPCFRNEVAECIRFGVQSSRLLAEAAYGLHRAYKCSLHMALGYHKVYKRVWQSSQQVHCNYRPAQASCHFKFCLK